MIEVTIQDHCLRQAAQESTDSFLNLIISATRDAMAALPASPGQAGSPSGSRELTAENMSLMSSQQITLIGFATLRDELMDGGFIQLIHNGYGPFFFKNPFDVAIRQWGEDLNRFNSLNPLNTLNHSSLSELCSLMRHARKAYQKYRDEITKEMTDEEFMALYELIPAFEDFDDEFVSNEEQWSNEVAAYVDNHLEDFIKII